MFGELLTHLRQHGFPLGVDHYLRLQELLDRVGDQCAPEDLKTLLSPIFAVSRSQQEQFYRAFDSYFSLFDPATLQAAPARPQLSARPKEIRRTRPAAATTPPPTTTAPPHGFQKKWLYIIAPVLLLALVLAIVLISRRNSTTTNQNTAGQANANAQQQPGNVNTGAPPVVELPPTATQPGFEQPNTNAPFTPPLVAEPGSIQQPQPTMPPASAQPTPAPNFYERNRTAIYLTALVVPLIVFLVYEWYRRRRRRLILARERRRRAPYVWPIKADAPLPKLFESEQFYTAARLLRRRQVDEFYRLDVEATVSATVASLGFPSFRYKSASKPPEYLALIDRASFRDHQAQLFNELTKALEAEGVFVARYFYDEDPRVVRSAGGEESLHLNELQNRYGTHRLLLFGDGAKLIDQLSGKLEMWTALLMNWQERAVLTPEPAARWGLRERALSQHFVMLPATLEGLQSLVDYFEAAVTPDMRVWARASGAGGAPVDFNRPITIKMLRDYLGKEVFEWLCACAIYPELHWDLTLYLGALPSLGNNLVQEKNLLRITGLPWFRTGSMPDNLRWLLINELPPEKARAIRTSLIQLLEKNAPPKETVAEESYRLNLVAQRWLHSRSRERLRELLGLMRKLPRSVALRDQTLIRSLETAPQPPLNITLPAHFRKLFYQSGLPAFGLRTSARFLVTVLTIGVAWVAILALAPRAQQQPNNLSALIAGSMPAPTPELFPGYSPPDYSAQNPGLDPSAFPPGTDPNAGVSGFPSEKDFPSAKDFPAAGDQAKPATPPAYTPPASGGGGPRFPRSSGSKNATTTPPVASQSPTPQPTPTPFPPLNASAQNAANQQSPAVNQTTETITPTSALTTQQEGPPSKQTAQQTFANKASKGGTGTQPDEQARARAAQAFRQAEQLRAQATRELLPQVINKYEEALTAYRAARDREGEAVMLYNIGKVYADLGDNQKALDYLNRALQLLRAIRYQPGEAATLNNIGVVYNSLGDRQKALDYYKQALTVAQQANNRAGHAAILSNVGRIYEGVGDKTIAQDFSDQSRSVWQTDLSPDKKIRATVSDNRQVKLTDTTTDQELRTLTGHTASVFEVAFSPDGKRLATAGDDGRIKIWNVNTGEEQLNFSPEATVFHLAFSPDGKTIATTETSGRIKVWDTTTGRLLSTTEPPAPAQPQQQQQNAPK